TVSGIHQSSYVMLTQYQHTPAIRTELDSFNRGRKSRFSNHRTQVGSVPNAKSAGVSAARNESTVRREVHIGRSALMQSAFELFFGLRQRPEPDRSRFAYSEKRAARRSEVQHCYTGCVLQRRGERLAGFNIPDARGVVSRRGCNLLAVWTEMRS